MVWRELILPVVATLLLISSLIGAGLSGLSGMLVALAVDGSVGWRLEPGGNARRLGDGRLWVRGEWTSFVQIVLVLVFRYVTSVAAAMNPVLAQDALWHTSILFVATLLSASFLGRAAARLRVYVAGPAEETQVERGI
jgi:hypothetical protein